MLVIVHYNSIVAIRANEPCRGKHASSNLTSKTLSYISRKKRKIGVAPESPATITLAWRTNGSKTQFHATVPNPGLDSLPCLMSQSG